MHKVSSLPDANEYHHASPLKILTGKFNWGKRHGPCGGQVGAPGRRREDLNTLDRYYSAFCFIAGISSRITDFNRTTSIVQGL